MNLFLLPHFFLQSCLKNPNKIALIVEKKEYTYQKIHEDIVELIYDFKKKGLIRQDRVLIQSGNSYESIIAFWAALFSDAIPCIVDTEMPESSAKDVLERIDPKIIFSDFIFKESSENTEKSPFYFSNVESDIAMIMHTSGSTGFPKGVVLSHRNVIAAMQSITQYLGLNQDDIILSVLPLHFDYGLYQMIMVFSIGATLVLEKNALFPNKIASDILKYQVTVLPCVPLLIQILTVLKDKYRYDFLSVRLATNTGENLSHHHIQKLKKLFPSAHIYSMYGLTECKRCSYVPPDQLDEKYDSIGVPMPNLEMWIQDDEGSRLNPNEVGNLVIYGPTVMQGYWRNQAETIKKITIDKMGRRILISGDKAMMDKDGFFYFKGRGDSIVKFKGAKLNCHDYIKKIGDINGIDRSYLFLKRDESDSQKLIVCLESDSTEKDNIQLKVASLFPSNQKPDAFYFMDHFPALSNGKLNKLKLEALAGSGVL